MTRSETIAQLRTLIRIADHYRNTIYMPAPATACRRRDEERRGTVPYFEWEEGGHKFTACYKVYCSVCHIYARGSYTRNGKKTNLTAIKNSLKRLEQEENENV